MLEEVKIRVQKLILHFISSFYQSSRNLIIFTVILKLNSSFFVFVYRKDSIGYGVGKERQ